MSNYEIRNRMKERGIKQWEIAEDLGISEFTLSRWLRKEIQELRRQRIFKTIERIARLKERGDANEQRVPY